MRFELDELQLDARDTLRKLVLEDDVLPRLDEFGAFDPSLVAVTFEAIGYAGLVMPDDRYGDQPVPSRRGAPLGAVVDDAPYAEWLLAQPWFGEKFPRHHSYVAAALARTLADAEGDPAELRRDDGPEAA